MLQTRAKKGCFKQPRVDLTWFLFCLICYGASFFAILSGLIKYYIAPLSFQGGGFIHTRFSIHDIQFVNCLFIEIIKAASQCSFNGTIP